MHCVYTPFISSRFSKYDLRTLKCVCITASGYTVCSADKLETLVS